MKNLLLLLLFSLLSLALSAQTPQGIPCNYRLLLTQGQEFVKNKDYGKALLKFNSARRCDPSKGDEIDAKIQTVFDGIEKQRKDAERDKLIAQKALKDLEKALADVVRSIISDADRMILNLDYEAAWRKLLTALPLNAAKTELAAALLEPAFWHAEAGYYARARGMLDTITGPGLLNNSSVQSLLRQLPQLDSAAQRLQLRECIRMLDDAAYVHLQQRYYPVMVRVPGGEFRMGNVMGDSTDTNATPHPVRLSNFEIATTETTIWQLSIYCATTGISLSKFIEASNREDPGNKPGVNITWYYAAVGYANWLNTRYWLSAKPPLDSAITWNKEKGYQLDLKAPGFRLPTEAEWEYAARGGGKTVRFGNGQDTARTSEINFSGSIFDNYYAFYIKGESRNRTSAVGSLTSPNALGLHDMSGNVCEWCWDWYAAYPTELSTDYTGPESGSSRVCRGGSWYTTAGFCRVAHRRSYNPVVADDYYGFRLARTF